MMTPEQEAVLRAIRKLVDFWHITPSELHSDAPAVAPLPRPDEPPPPPRHRYRHPLSGATWDGQGAQPQWLREALTREGYTVQELRLSEDVAPE
ncbi:H-NS family nucleoid-associated regulatory protein [uncultured Aquabacterium sp.]|jgi:DNA-binding protein H-NS|uniref:H-NS family nucleoid-associated regulatory protein n=1 Tax=uncultured Aquabacterium sp. TaxID=158753 RepID=UPI002627D95D|nr:H-NS family nucleoid-associated regulatory protein [uncultured Aquabacterium sp.]